MRRLPLYRHIALVAIALLLLGPPGWGEDPPPKPGTYTEAEQEKIRALFNATSANFDEDGRLSLTYDFQSMEDTLPGDWTPEMSTTKGKIRWARGIEGTRTTVEHGIVIADAASWFHKARWTELRLEVVYLSMSGTRKGDLLAAAFLFHKQKRTVGSNMGQQCVTIQNGKIAGTPNPKEPPGVVAEGKYTFGFELKDGVFHAQRDGKSKASSEGDAKFLRDLSPGHGGLVWNGTIQGFVFRVTLEGNLDPTWVTAELEK